MAGNTSADIFGMRKSEYDIDRVLAISAHDATHSRIRSLLSAELQARCARSDDRSTIRIRIGFCSLCFSMRRHLHVPSRTVRHHTKKAGAAEAWHAPPRGAMPRRTANA